MKVDYFSEVKESALRLLARREYGSFELKQKLLGKGFKLITIEEVLLLFKNLDLQSDKRFVECYIRRRAAKGFGPLHIKNELLKINIQEHLIETEMACYASEWKELLKQICYKKFGSIGFLSDKKMRAKQIRFFQTRGFCLYQINDALLSLSE